jgi:hypothetical protein
MNRFFLVNLGMIKLLKVFSKVLIGSLLFTTLSIVSCTNNSNSKNSSEVVIENDEKEEYDGPAEIAEFEFMRTKDPALNYVPTERLMIAKQLTMESKARSPYSMSAFGVWEERGPISDVPGPSNGNTRANSGISAGRIRAMLIDKADATGKTLFIGGVDGGIWKTTDITVNPANWVPLTDNLNNLAISDIVQDPTNLDVMYFCTGESFSNVDAVRGVGVFKSVDHGVTWTLLPSTSTYVFCTRIVCDASGNIYLGTNGNGILRSMDGGSSWTNITPTGSSSRIADVEISSTGRLHITTGLGNSALGVYRFTDIPTTVNSGTWTAATTAFPYPSGANCRVELGCRDNTLYALPSNTSAQIPTIYKSTNGGVTWAATSGQPTSSWASGQAWYALSVDINPADLNQCIVGGLDTHKTLDGGITWTKISEWVGTIGQYVHADQHKIIWYDGGNKLLFGCDGGVHYSTDGGVTIRDRNTGLRIKQFYSVAAHPTNVNYFLGGTQDNGSHQFTNAGLSSTIEVTGGDGCFVHIDQDEPQFQFTSFVFNQYRRSTNGGATFSNVNLSSTTGQFINPTDYDDLGNVMYCSNTAGTYRRWTDPQIGSTSATVSITSLGASNSVSAVTVSPYTSNRIYLGTYSYNTSTGAPLSSTVVYVDAANTTATGSAGVNITAGLPTNGSVSCIATGTNDNNLMVSYSNYGVNSVWISNNNGTSWTSVEGNLPDMPVRWCMFAPGDNSKAIIATETGVWFTQSLNGASTVWTASPGFPAVRTDMLAYRSLDGTVAAATHGRGLWTQTALSILPLNNFTLRGRWTGSTAELNWNNESLPLGSTFEIESSIDAISYTKIGTVSKSSVTNYSFKYVPQTGKNIFFRIKGVEQTGAIKYSNIVRLSKDNSTNGTLEITKLYPNPVQDLMNIGFNVPEKGIATYTVTAMNGQTIWKRQEKLEFSGNYSITEYAAVLKPGNYVFTILLNGQKSSLPFIKK